MIALAVDEDERLVGGQAAQRRRAHERLSVGGGQALHVEGRQQLRQHGGEIARYAGLHQRLRQHVDRRQRIELRPAALPRAGHDDVISTSSIRRGLTDLRASLGRSDLRRNGRREKNVQRRNGAGGSEFHDDTVP